MNFEIFIKQQYMMGVMARTQPKQDGTQIVHLLSRRSGLWIPVTQQQLDEQDIPAECLFMVQELASTDRT
jgi:hypothetical protein